jgi:hypothetical protein
MDERMQLSMKAPRYFRTAWFRHGIRKVPDGGTATRGAIEFVHQPIGKYRS